MHAPISVLPVPFPRDSFEKAKAAMQIFNKLIDRVSRDGAYLRDTLQAASEFDDFTVSTRTEPCPCGVILATSWAQLRLAHVLCNAFRRSTLDCCEPYISMDQNLILMEAFGRVSGSATFLCRPGCCRSTKPQMTGASRELMSSWCWPSTDQTTCLMSPPVHCYRYGSASSEAE